MRSVRQLLDLTGRKALVTGGSRGLGLQIAEALGEQGAEIVLIARRQPGLDAALAHLTQRGIHASAIAADLADETVIAEVVAETVSRLQHIDILINNAGTSWGMAAETHSIEAWDKVMNLNIRSIFLLSQAVGKQSMIPRRYGRIVNIASIAGLTGNRPDMMHTLAYNTSKGALVNFTRALASEWGHYGITVNAIAPGFFPSRMTEGIIEKFGKENLVQHAPLSRLGDEEDLKGAALLFSSDAGKYITGQVLAVDGGISAV